MTGTSLAPADRRESSPRVRSYNRTENSLAELMFFAITGHDPSIRLERDLRMLRLGAQVFLYVGSLVVKEMARSLLRRAA